MSTDVVIALAELAAVILAGIAILVSLRGIRDQLWLTTFAEYTRRYAEIMEDLPFEARRPGGAFDTAALPADMRERVMDKLRLYLNLCSEEFYLFQRGRIDSRTWHIWKTGMRDSLRLPCFRGGWNGMREEYEFFPDFVSFMDGLGRAPTKT